MNRKRKSDAFCTNSDAERFETHDVHRKKPKIQSLSQDFIDDCKVRFHNNPINIISRNTVNTVGVMGSCIDPDRMNNISHVFEFSLKPEHVKATNQGHSGRCWMFAVLNIFRNLMMNRMNLKTFEFSQAYLFFWDKFERANSYISWFIEHPEAKSGDNAFNYMIS